MIYDWEGRGNKKGYSMFFQSCKPMQVNISVDFDWSAFPILYISGFIQELVSAVICVAAIVILPGLLFLLFASVLCVWRLWGCVC